MDKRGVEPKDVMMVNPRVCEDSAQWSERLTTGESYKDVELPEAAVPMPPGAPEVYTPPEDKSYSTISHKVFNSYKILADDKEEWLQGVDDYNAKEEAMRFRQVDIQWSDNLAGLALEF